MPRPTVSQVHRNAILDRISIAYRNDAYIAPLLFPVVSVEKQSDFYYIFDKSSWFRDRVAYRAPGTRAKRADYALTTASYFCMPYALAKGVPDEVVRNADSPLRPAVEAAEFVTDGLLLGEEIRVADLITASANWTSASIKNGASAWSIDTSTPLEHIDTAVDAVISSIGRKPNVAVMSWNVWRYLKNHPDLAERVKYTRPGGTPVADDLANWFGLDKVLIGTAIKDTAQEGAAASISYVWGNGFWVGYVPGSPGLMTPSAGYIMEWGGRSVDTFREDQERQNVYEASHYSDEVITASDAGALLTSLV